MPKIIRSPGKINPVEEEIRTLASDYDVSSDGFDNSIAQLIRLTKNPDKTAELVTDLLSTKVSGYDWDPVIPLLPKSAQVPARKFFKQYHNFKVGDVLKTLAASMLGMERGILNRTIAGDTVGVFNDQYPVLRNTFTENLQRKFAEAGYEANFNSLAPYVAPDIGLRTVIASGNTSILPASYQTPLNGWQIQRMLNQIVDGGLELDGIVGDQTRESVRVFQTLYGLAPDGVVGAQTTAALLSLFGESSVNNG
jgi:peptidoglycan hydrolase-like protein with peptidoglycan-binding domain